MKKFSVIALFLAIISSYLVYKELMRQRNYDEIQKICNFLNIDVHAIYESNQIKKLNLFNIFRYYITYPKVCIENYKFLKEKRKL